MVTSDSVAGWNSASVGTDPVPLSPSIILSDALNDTRIFAILSVKKFAKASDSSFTGRVDGTTRFLLVFVRLATIL